MHNALSIGEVEASTNQIEFTSALTYTHEQATLPLVRVSGVFFFAFHMAEDLLVVTHAHFFSRST